MVEQTIVALDIDGTLIDLAGAGSRAMQSVLAELLESKSGHQIPEMVFAGRTDLAIALDALTQLHRLMGKATPTESEVRSFLEKYLARLPEELERTPYLPTNGALELVRQLSEDSDVLVGIATGNIKAAAHMKLNSAGFHEFFDFGAYGDEAWERTELLRLAFERAERSLGSAPATRRFVMGDTPADIEAARAVGACSIAVTTGPYNSEQLIAFSPDFIFSSPHEAIMMHFWSH